MDKIEAARQERERQERVDRERIERYPILRYFDYEHLPEPQAALSQRFHDLAHELGDGRTAGPETSAGLRKLLEAKDCFVRASLCERRVEESR